MGRKRPATISSSPPDERGRVGSRGPPGHSHHHASKPLKVRALTASANPASAGVDGTAAALPPILPGKRLRTSQRHAAPLEPRSPSKQQVQKRKQRPSAVSAPAGSPHGARQPGTTSPPGSDVSNVARGGDGAAVGVRAVAAPFTTQAAAAAAAAAASTSEVAPHPRRSTRQPNSQQGSSPVTSPSRQQHQPYRRKPTTQNTAPKPAVVKPAVQPTPVKEEEQEEEEVEALTADEKLLLCGVQPGTSKALWFTSMRSQLDSRGGSSVSFYATVDEGSSGVGAAALHSPFVSRSTGATPTPLAASLLSSPLQVPQELLWLDSGKKADRRPRQPAVRTALPSSPVPRSPQRASPPPDSSSSPTADDERGSEANVEDEDGHRDELDTAPLPQHREASSSSVAHSEATSSADGHYDNDAEDDEVSASMQEEEEEEEDEIWNRYASSSSRKVSSGTRRPMSEAANLLAQLRAAVEHRKSEVSLDGAAESQLHRLRPSVHQLQDFRVRVLSLEPGTEEM